MLRDLGTTLERLDQWVVNVETRVAAIEDTFSREQRRTAELQRQALGVIDHARRLGQLPLA